MVRPDVFKADTFFFTGGHLARVCARGARRCSLEFKYLVNALY